MISRILKRFGCSQRGFTLIELMIALAIMALIGGGATIATVQILKQSVRNRDFTTASQFTMNAIHWISRDAEMSQVVTTNGTTGFPLTLRWTDWSNGQYQVIYSIENNILKRKYSINGGQQTQTILAESVNTVSQNTTCQYSNKVLNLQVTATVGKGAYAVTVANTREIFMRSMP